MSHSDDQYDHPIEHHDPQEGYDHTEPNTPAIWLFTIVSVLGLILVIVAVQGYFEQIWKEAVYERVLSVPSEQLQDVRNRDAWNLTHYMYGNLDKVQSTASAFPSTRPCKLSQAKPPPASCSTRPRPRRSRKRSRLRAAAPAGQRLRLPGTGGGARQEVDSNEPETHTDVRFAGTGGVAARRAARAI